MSDRPLRINRRQIVSFIQYDILETLQNKLIHPSGFTTFICSNPSCFPPDIPPLPALTACQIPAALTQPPLHMTLLLVQMALGAGATPKHHLASAAVSRFTKMCDKGAEMAASEQEVALEVAAGNRSAQPGSFWCKR